MMYTPRWRRGSKRDPAEGGFTLIELMTSIAITGIIASVALPTFAKYKQKAVASEAFVHLGTMLSGVQAYYQQDHWQQGVVSSGSSGRNAAKNAEGTACIPPSIGTSNIPSSKKTVLDWSNESSAFGAINFQPAEALLFNYRVGVAILPGDSSYLGTAGTCGSGVSGWFPSCCSHPPGNGAGNFQIEARGRPNDGPTVTSMVWGLCTNEANSLFVCYRRLGPAQTVCSVGGAPGAAIGYPALGPVLAIFGVLVLLHRRRL